MPDLLILLREPLLQLRGDYIEARYNLGNALLRRGDVDGAIAQCEAALTLNSRSVEAHNNLANALRQKGAYVESIGHYQTALSLEPRSVPVANNLAWLLATCRDASLRDPRRAVALAQAANEESGGTNPVVLHTLSAACAQSGDFAGALAAALHALQLAEATGDRNLGTLLRGEIAQINAQLNRDR